MKEKKISVNSILLDTGNPRIDPVTDQSSAIASMLDECGEKILKLSDNIIKHGVNPTDLPICQEETLASGRKVYIVREGNRRVLAIKSILKPQSITNAGWKSKFLRLIRQSGGVGLTPQRLQVVVFGDNESEAMKHWIVIKHNGENGGAGTVPWGAEEQARFSGDGRNIFAITVKAWLKNRQGVSPDDVQKIESMPITTFDRIISSAQGRVILGVSYWNGKLHATRKVENVAANLMRVVSDLTTPDSENPRKMRVNVSDVKNASQIQTYLREFQREDDYLDTPVLLTADVDSDLVSGLSSTTGGRNQGPRRGTVPMAASKTYLRNQLRGLEKKASNSKVKKLADEMLQMNVDKQSLSFCIVFRSLLDISLHEFARRNGIPVEGVKIRDLITVCKNKVLSKPGWDTGIPKGWINEACRTLGSCTLFSITELHNLVHGTMHVPSCEIILNYAPRVIPFLMALNGGNPPDEV